MNLTPEQRQALSEIGRVTQALRKSKRGGRPPKISKCKQCGASLSARAMRKHKCPTGTSPPE